VDSGPLLLAIDDLQWLDPSSVHVIAYAARRLSAPVGIVGTVRTDDTGGDAASWLQMHRPDAVHRITVRPLSIRDLRTVVMRHVERPIPQSSMASIHQISGGNPFYAIELARAFDGTVEKFLPSTLAELVRARIEGLGPAVHDALLAAACVAAPTVELVTNVADTEIDRVVELLEAAEHQGVVVIEGNRIRFTHPLLATGVYTTAGTEQRQRVHRRLADVVGDAELRARHLALATTTSDPDTLRALDEAADVAHARGAPAAAAELLDLAISLGGDNPQRRARLAAHCFDCGDPGRAKTLLESAIDQMEPGLSRAEALYSLAVVRFSDDGYLEASELLERALTEDGPAADTRVKIVTALAHALYNTGRPEAAMSRAEEAVELAEHHGVAALLSQALAARSMLRFLAGEGIDEPSLHRAATLEDFEMRTPTVLQPSLLYALQLGWIGDLDEGYDQMLSIRRRCVERGEEGDLIFIDFQVALNRIWRGDFAEANRATAEAMELARRLGGDFPLMLGQVMQACIAAYTAAEDDARQDISAAVDASKRCGTVWHDEWTRTALGFFETSLMNYEAAVDALEPLVARFAETPGTAEIFAAAFLPDAVEALAGLGRVAEAEPLVDALERNGRRMNRAWMLAVGARSRALVLAAKGNTESAAATAVHAMVHHDRLPMPFERARTLLLLGQLQCQQRDRSGANSLRSALSAFEDLGATRWADRARAELASTDAARGTPGLLTDTERRVADLAASGKTNREVGDILFVSAKTVEATLARVYRKLGIRSRAELGQTMGRPEI
jgi:DNA-binding CsgD family transcriptional regulator